MGDLIRTIIRWIIVILIVILIIFLLFKITDKSSKAKKAVNNSVQTVKKTNEKVKDAVKETVQDIKEDNTATQPEGVPEEETTVEDSTLVVETPDTDTSSAVGLIGIILLSGGAYYINKRKKVLN